MKHLVLFAIGMIVATTVVAQGQQQNTPQAPQGGGRPTGVQAPQNGAQPQQRQQQAAPESTEWYYPVPAKVQPGVGTKPPSDAIILFDGTDCHFRYKTMEQKLPIETFGFAICNCICL